MKKNAFENLTRKNIFLILEIQEKISEKLAEIEFLKCGILINLKTLSELTF